MPDHLRGIVAAFEQHESAIGSAKNTHRSDLVLLELAPTLKLAEYEVEAKGKSVIEVPVLFGRDNRPRKRYLVDAYNPKTQTILEVDAGQATENNAFLKHLIE